MKIREVRRYGLSVAVIGVMLMSPTARGDISTAFTYQGELSDGGSPATGSYDFIFDLYSSMTGGTAAHTVSTNGVTVTDGYFEVYLNYGDDVFTGASWVVEIRVRPSGGGAYETLTPRQPILPTPYAMCADSIADDAVNSAKIADGTIAFADIGQNSAGSGQVMKWNGSAWAAADDTGGGSLAGYAENGTFSPAPSASGTDAIAQGRGSEASGDRSVVGGGLDNRAAATVSTVGGGNTNTIGSTSSGAAISGGSKNDIGLASDYAAIGGGYDNAVGDTSSSAAIGGGYNNSIYNNSAYTTVAGGRDHNIGPFGSYSSVGGGQDNDVLNNSPYATISGGANHDIGPHAEYATIGGGDNNTIAFSLDYATIGGGKDNTISTNASSATIGGGHRNDIGYDADYATVGGGSANSIGSYSDFATVGGGFANDIGSGAYNATVGGGSDNNIGYDAGCATVGGGVGNDIGPGANFSTVGGGQNNDIGSYSDYATVGGGSDNEIARDADYSTIPGGNFCEIGTDVDYAFAAGNRAKANHDGAFVWADSQDSDFASTATNQVSFRCQGGVVFSSGAGGANQSVSWTPGSASWAFSSDRALKEEFVPVDAAAVLDKVARLPMSEWNYKGYPQRHIGPMAQDFHALFPLNESDTTLNSADLHGVALAAIQGLCRENDELRAMNEELRNALEDVKARLTALEAR